MEKKEAKSYTEALKTLTPREAEILELTGKGLTNSEIAETLHLSVRTIHAHKYRISRKLSIKGHNGLLKWLLRVRIAENGDGHGKL